MPSFKPIDGWIRLAPKVLFRPSHELRGVGLHLEVSSTFAEMQAAHMNAEGAPAAAVAQWQVFDKLLKEGRNVVALGPDVDPPLSFLVEGTAVAINGGPGCEPGSLPYRERRRHRFRCLWVELHEEELDAFVKNGLLDPKARNDENAIADALYAHLERTLGSSA